MNPRAARWTGAWYGFWLGLTACQLALNLIWLWG